MTPQTVPDALCHTRVRIPAPDGGTTFDWKTVSTGDLFAGRRIVLFALPGAFTPACSETHLPGYERLHDQIIAEAIDEVLCLSVNDAFVMGQWGRALEIDKVRMLPDGNGTFTRLMGMLVDRSAQGMGLRSWRYSMVVEDRKITRLFAEPGFQDSPPGVPVTLSGAETMLAHLRGGQ